VNKADRFYFTADPTKDVSQLTPDQFDIEFQHLVPALGKQKRRIKPRNLIQKYNPETNIVRALGMYPAIRDRLVALPNNFTALNIHDPIPIYKVDKPREPKVLLDHFLYILNGDKKHRQHLLNVMCHMVFRPETRLTHGTLISGVGGTGKSSIGDITSKLIGFNNASNVEMKDVKGSFQNWMMGKRLIVVHEVKEPNNHGLYNKMKSWFTEDQLFLNIKYGSAVLDNHLHFMMFSNDQYPFPIEEGNRRIWYVHSNAKKRDKEYYNQLFEAKGVKRNEIGTEIPHLYHYLKTKVLPMLPANFAHAGVPETQSSASAIAASMNPLAQFLEESLASEQEFFQPGVWFLKKDLMTYLRDPAHGVSHMMRSGLTVQSTLEKYGLRERKRTTVNGRKITVCWFDSEASADLFKLFYLNTKDAQQEKRKRVYDPDWNVYRVSQSATPEEFETFDHQADGLL